MRGAINVLKLTLNTYTRTHSHTYIHTRMRTHNHAAPKPHYLQHTQAKYICKPHISKLHHQLKYSTHLHQKHEIVRGTIGILEGLLKQQMIACDALHWQD